MAEENWFKGKRAITLFVSERLVDKLPLIRAAQDGSAVLGFAPSFDNTYAMLLARDDFAPLLDGEVDSIPSYRADYHPIGEDLRIDFVPLNGRGPTYTHLVRMPIGSLLHDCVHACAAEAVMTRIIKEASA